MTKKIKLIDRLKSWLVTLGIASVFGLAALGVNAANSYQKTSAYEYQVNGALSFTLGQVNNQFDNILLINFFETVAPDNEEHSCRFDVVDETERVIDCRYYAFNLRDNTKTLSFYDNGDNQIIDLILSNNSVSFDVDIDENGYVAPMEFTILPSYEFYQGLRNYVLSYNAPQESGNFITALTSFMSLIGGGIVDLAQTIGAGVVSFASGLFLDSGHLSILGGIIGIFAGIALAVGITSKVYTWVSTLGN